MESTLPLFKPDAAQTLAYAAGVLFLGFFLKKKIRIVDRLNVPAPVVGGMLVAVVLLLMRGRVAEFEFDGSLRPVLELGFFTTIGMSASLAVLKRGGVQVLVFLALATFLCLAQNALGMSIAWTFGIHPLVGVMAGSLTLVGGPATGAAFAKQFAERGVAGADSLAIAAATFGIVCGALLGGPVGTWLIEKRVGRARKNGGEDRAGGEAEAGSAVTLDVDREETPLLRNIMIVALAMGLGVVVSGLIEKQGVTLPAYIGAMIMACVLRNFDDGTGWLRISMPLMDLIGAMALAVYLANTLLRLRLWEIAHLAAPLVVILLAQVAFMAVFTILVSFPVMGRDYESGVMSAGLIGFALGTMVNALTNMRALVERYGAAPRAFLVVPLVGAGMLDAINSALVTVILNYFPK